MKFYGERQVYSQDNEVGNYSGERFSRIEILKNDKNTSRYLTSHHVVEERIEPVKLYDENWNLIGIDLISVSKDVVTCQIDRYTGVTKVSIFYAGKRFEGRAKCHKDDEFDAGIGFQLAYSRALIDIEVFKMKRVIGLVGGRD